MSIKYNYRKHIDSLNSLRGVYGFLGKRLCSGHPQWQSWLQRGEAEGHDSVNCLGQEVPNKSARVLD